MISPVPFGPDYGFGAYIHWPYCARICPYCDFNVYAAKTRDTAPLLNAICADIKHHRTRLETHPPLNSVYLGGGTPSLLTGSEIARIVETCATSFGLAENVEITLEANPNTLMPDRAADWRAAGVNRLSIGVQSLSDAALQFLGRDHSAKDAKRAIEIARNQFPSISLDLIYARPGQSLADWEDELKAALSLGAQHISLYELTIEPATAFGRATARGTLTPMPDEAQADLYEATSTLMGASGYPAYEISNHAISPAHRSVHNLTYWRSGDWLGVGPGAHGRLTHGKMRIATEAARRPADYINAVQATGTGNAPSPPLSRAEAAHELLAMGLRSVEGIARTRLDSAFTPPLSDNRIEVLKTDGWLTCTQDHLALTERGRLLADRIVADLIG